MIAHKARAWEMGGTSGMSKSAQCTPSTVVDLEGYSRLVVIPRGPANLVSETTRAVVADTTWALSVFALQSED
jgi:hypothetical protein